MSPTYKAVGINLKAMPLGESDRLLTVLTRDQGLLKLVAAGARQPKSKLGGRTALFVVNHLLIRPGRTLDKIAQCELIYAYPRLSQHLTTLAAGQYVAEIVLYLARQQQTQADLFDLFCQTLQDLEQVQGRAVMETLLESIWQILAWAGITPQWDESWLPDNQDLLNPDWRIGFNLGAGSFVPLSQPLSSLYVRGTHGFSLLSAGEFQILAWIAAPVEARQGEMGRRPIQPLAAWLGVERLLRQYMQFHLEHPLKAASLLDSCFSPIPAST
ncbi:DNA repair protein RecO [Thermosynechococcaceae cyanobacterium BACA0444]|uniref:DNA repair protein RecO n=1 Tax=Pseudocalidococcus azoricus BACA0444 TaxID=2918990 RepID=A0AAE4JZR0_9CYAN|nr:DNA repair protein RecO [Pseudocalidococcus azoricus]MDS3862424.1 DNA repair protein RecO [Pseudocalidococcus azoricus BACA0444]